MKKDEFVTRISSETGITKTEAESVLKSFTAAVTGSLIKGDRVTLSGLGTFSITRRGAREGRNPRTGETIQIGASNGVKFKAGKALKDAVQ